MTASLLRRGPNSGGLHRWPRATLGHRRLAILDLSPAGAQPMLSDDGKVGVTFNGCIYNFLALRQELESEGIAFRSNCDTEVLLHGYRQWGIDRLVSRLRGMFAFGVWDDAENRLTLVRDRLGVKPLVYAEREGSIVFASTTRAIRDSGLRCEVDPQAVLAFLEFGYVPEERTIYEGVHKLPAGTILEWRQGRASQRPYWTLADADETSKITFPEAVEEAERLLIQAVGLRLHADVPLAALLSAGIDSSLVCWAITQLNRDVQTFTVGTPGDPADESAEAAATAKRLGVSHRTVTLPQSSPEELLSDLTNAFGEPFSCSSALGMLQVSQAAAPHATVLLTGDGGDDVFLGYPFQYHWYLAQRTAQSTPTAVLRLWPHLRGLVPTAGPFRRLRHFMDYAAGGLGAVTRVHDGLPYYEGRALLGERLEKLALPQRQIQMSPAAGRALLSEALQYEQDMRFRSEFLTKVDAGTMYHSLEARSPFLDHELWDFAARLPSRIRLQKGILKAVLRKIAADRLGSDVANRRKQGFTIPVEEWLATRWSESLRVLESGSRIVAGGWIRGAPLSASIQTALERKRAPLQLWNLLVLERWLAMEESFECRN